MNLRDSVTSPPVSVVRPIEYYYCIILKSNCNVKFPREGAKFASFQMPNNARATRCSRGTVFSNLRSTFFPLINYTPCCNARLFIDEKRKEIVTFRCSYNFYFHHRFSLRKSTWARALIAFITAGETPSLFCPTRKHFSLIKKD